MCTYKMIPGECTNPCQKTCIHLVIYRNAKDNLSNTYFCWWSPFQLTSLLEIGKLPGQILLYSISQSGIFFLVDNNAAMVAYFGRRFQYQN